MWKVFTVTIFLLCSSCSLLESGIEDIEFHGVVVDQYGNPVEGVAVRFDASGYFLGAGAGMGARRTDSGGRFVIETEGGAVTIRGFEHPQLDKLKLPTPQGEMRNTVATFRSHQRQAGGDEYLWRDYTKDNPFVFHVWRISAGDTDGVMANEVFFSPVPDARTYTVNLAENRGRDKVLEGDARRGQLQVRFFRADKEGVNYSLQENSGARLDWWVEVSAIDGGLVPVAEDDPYMNLAPESGYRPSIRIAMSLQDNDYRRKLLDQRYYYKARDGKYYGVIVADFYSIGRGEPLVRFRHKTNTRGRRQLVALRAPFGM